MSEKEKNTPKSFLEMGNSIKESQFAVLNFVEQNKYAPSTDKTEYHEELKIMIEMFFGSLKMITCCYVLFNRVELLKNHKSLDVLGLIKELYVDIQQRIEEKS